MQALKITAHLVNGFASSDPWSPAIDGILAYWHKYRQLGGEAFAEQATMGDLTPVDDLPLAKTEHDGEWWYQCSMPIYQAQAEFLRHFHRRFDAMAAARHTTKQGKVETRCAPYKATRLTSRIIVTREIAWHVVGDKAAIESLLSDCHWIGSKIGVGNGRVLRWSIVDGDEDLAKHHRPLPVAYAERQAIDGLAIYWGIRPPGRLSINKTDCVIPKGVMQHAGR